MRDFVSRLAAYQIADTSLLEFAFQPDTLSKSQLAYPASQVDKSKVFLIGQAIEQLLEVYHHCRVQNEIFLEEKVRAETGR
jgi:hypothetical protein